MYKTGMIVAAIYNAQRSNKNQKVLTPEDIIGEKNQSRNINTQELLSNFKTHIYKGKQ